MNNTDQEYFRLVNLVLEKGKWKNNRTGIKTLSYFGTQSRYNLEEGFPLLTTKKVFFKGIVHELIWFLSGSINIKYLVDNDVHIWDEWAYNRYLKTPLLDKPLIQEDNVNYLKREMYEREFIQEIKSNNEFAKWWGDLGEGIYGSMWRGFPYFNEENHPDEIHHVDQIYEIIGKLKTNPDDRRLIVSAWHPYWYDKCALSPCHILFQFYTEELTISERYRIKQQKDGNIGTATTSDRVNSDYLDSINIPKRRLNCHLYQRSGDLGLGVPFNIASYSLLLKMVAQVVNMVPSEFIHSIGDLHIYENHIDKLKEQIKRESLPLPRVELNRSITDIFKFKYDDIKLIDYKSHDSIKMDVAI